MRKIPFSFEGVEFIWNRDNPVFSIAMNKMSFFAIGFERYICQAVRDAEALIKDPEVLAEARAFREQEAIHSVAHRKHIKALIARYPGLQGTLDKVIGSFDELYKRESLKFHLGYVGGLESVFTPMFRMLIDHRDVLFEKGDARVASLFLWHFFEEIEHRSSGLIVYDEVVGSYLYRVRNYRHYMRHAKDMYAMMDAEFREHVTDVPHSYYMMKSDVVLPLKSRLRSFFGILAAQLPWHNPEHEALPDYYYEWGKRYQGGEDMTRIYGTREAEPVHAEPELVAA
ncbi:metal-dependent hydrolase [Sphingomonas bacterium]|uniref:metal-dependent hydrolase n=1 Tax=Sphingomonas bacterium TaxID=1895847 RepID=UPI001C2CDE21|nr:metal-dependent hydrolase [Sphingomonas bacterium]